MKHFRYITGIIISAIGVIFGAINIKMAYKTISTDLTHELIGTIAILVSLMFFLLTLYHERQSTLTENTNKLLQELKEQKGANDTNTDNTKE